MSNEIKNWFSRHGDTLTIIGVVCCGFLWADNKFDKVGNKIDSLSQRLNDVERDLSDRLNKVENEMNIIKTIMIMQGIYPKDLLAKGEG